MINVDAKGTSLLPKHDISDPLKRLLLRNTPSATQNVGNDETKSEDLKSKAIDVKIGEKAATDAKVDDPESKENREISDDDDDGDIPNPVAINARYAHQAKEGEEAVVNRRYVGKTKENNPIPHVLHEVKKPLPTHVQPHLDLVGARNTQSIDVSDSPRGNKESQVGNERVKQLYQNEQKQLELPKVSTPFKSYFKFFC